MKNLFLGIITIVIVIGCGNKIETNETEQLVYENNSDAIVANRLDVLPDIVIDLIRKELKKFDIVDCVIKDSKHGLCLIKNSDSLCTNLYLVSYTDSNLLEIKDVGLSCDHDTSIPSHEWQEHLTQNDSGFFIATITQHVNDSFLIDYQFPPNKSFYDYPINIDTLKILFYSLKNNGRINVTTPN